MAVMGKLFEAMAKEIAEATCSQGNKAAMVAALVRVAERAARDERIMEVPKVLDRAVAEFTVVKHVQQTKVQVWGAGGVLHRRCNRRG